MDMQQQPIEPNRPMTAQLTAEQWETVLRHLNTGQHGIVRPIIDSLMQQLQRQSQPPPSRFSTEDVAERVVPDGP
jgi:hypothetical protein